MRPHEETTAVLARGSVSLGIEGGFHLGKFRQRPNDARKRLNGSRRARFRIEHLTELTGKPQGRAITAIVVPASGRSLTYRGRGNP
jgi:hypothetical protein